MYKLRQQAQFYADFLQLLGRLLENGFSLQQAFAFLPIVFPKQRQWLNQVNQALEKGDSLAVSLAHVDFPTDYVGQIELTELQGNLGQCLWHLGRIQSIRQKRHREIRGVLAYPLFLLAFLGGLIGLLRHYLLPEIAQITPESNQTGSPLNRIILWGFLLVLVLLIMGRGLFMIYRRLPVLVRLQKAFKWPIIGRDIQQYYHYCLLFDLSTCLQNGLKLPEICALQKQLQQNTWLVTLVAQLEVVLASGQSLDAYLSRSAFFPQSLRLVLAKHNLTQQTTDEITMLANLQYTELQKQLQRKVSWLQPILFILIGFIIICTYLSILLPLYQTMEGIS